MPKSALEKQEIVYHGARDAQGQPGRVWLVSRFGRYELPWRTDVLNHGAPYLDWGNESDSAAQLSFALLCSALLDELRAGQLHQEFKRKWIATIGANRWTMTSTEIKARAHEIEFERTPKRSEKPAWKPENASNDA